MSIKYYYATLSPGTTDGTTEYRLFAVLQNSWYWAIEWKTTGEDRHSHLTDFNAGAMSATVKDSLSALRLIASTELRSRFGSFADYIERAVSEYGNYIAKICQDAKMPDVIWRISES
jgi:hypothetical protein